MGSPTADQSFEKPKTNEESNSNLINGELDPDDEDSLIKSPLGQLVGSVPVDESQEWKDKSLNLGSKFRILKRTDQIWEFQTVIRGKYTDYVAMSYLVNFISYTRMKF